jgi:hypothetical protein
VKEGVGAEREGKGAEREGRGAVREGESERAERPGEDQRDITSCRERWK